MGWENRRGGPTYYKSVRIVGRPTKVYCGKGEYAASEARAVEQRRQKRQNDRAAWEHELQKSAVAEQTLHDFRQLIDLLARATFLLSGFHEHRGQFRRKRNARDGNQTKGSARC